MTECIIPLKTPTLAKKAERALTSAGIIATVVSVDPSITKHGCGYGLSVFCRDAQLAKALLDRRHISYGELIGGYTEYDLS